MDSAEVKPDTFDRVDLQADQEVEILEAELGVGKGKKEIFSGANDFAYNNKIILLKTYEVRGRGVGKAPLIFLQIFDNRK